MTTPFPAHVEITGAGLRLREWTDDDLPAMVELFDDADITRWTPQPSPYDLAAATAHLTRAREARALHERIHLAVTTDGRVPRGEVLLFRTGGDPDEVELGYMIGAAHRRQGLASRALDLLAGYAVRTLGMRRLLLRIDPGNVASIAVARAAGFELTDDSPVVRDLHGRRVPLHTWCRPGRPAAGPGPALGSAG